MSEKFEGWEIDYTFKPVWWDERNKTNRKK